MKTRFLILLLGLILTGVFWQWWLPGPRVANDFSLVSQGALKSQLNLPQTWSVKGTEGLGEYTIFTLWSWPFSFFQGVFAYFNLSFTLLERFLIIIPFLMLGGLGIWKMCRNLNLSIYAKFISTLFYLTNTYILLVIDGGQLTISLSYALFPWGFIFLENAVSGNLKKKILAGLLISVIGFFDIRFLYIFFLLGFIKFLFESNLIISWLKTLSVILLVLLGINAFWLLTLIKFPISSNTYSSFTQTSLTSFITFPHALLMLSPHWFKNVFGVVTPLHPEFIIFPVLAFLTPILKIKNKNVGFWLVVAMVSLLLTKGSSEPFGYIYSWLYKNIPGFSLFRDSSKFFFLVALSYSVLIGIGLDEILKRIKNYKIKTCFFVILVGFLVFITRPVWLGWMTGTFSQPILQKEYSNLNNFLDKDQVKSNVFWIPTIPPLTVLDENHPALEASRLAQKRPFQQAIKGTYETFNFLRAPYMGQLFDVANIGYMAYPPLDLRRETDADKIKYYYTFLNQLSHLPWLKKIDESKIPLLKIKAAQDKLFIAPSIWWIIGSDEIYQEVTKRAKMELSKNALIFSQEDSNLSKRIDEMPFSKIALYRKEPLDLIASLIKSNDLIFPAKNLGRSPDQNGWWQRQASDLVLFRDFLQTKYGLDNRDFDLGGGWAVAEGDLKLRIKNSKISQSNILLARVLESSRSGEISFYQDKSLIGSIDTKKEKTNIKWFELGTLKNNSDIVLSTHGEINIINALAIVTPQVWQQYKKKEADYQNRIAAFDQISIDDSSARVDYQQLTGTKYIVTISNLTKPGMLVFAQNYDNKWKLNGQNPFPLYSFLNGYYIEKDGQYTLEFEAQKYVLPGLIISSFTILICLALLFV